MARNNFVFEYGEISEDIYYDVLKRDSKSTPYLRMHLVVSRTPDAPPLRGLRVCVYGYDAVWIQAGVYKGSRIAVMGHIQRRVHEGKNIFEIVAEDVQLLHNVNWEAAMEARKGLVDKGYLLPWSESVTGMSPDVFYANQHLSNDPEFAEGQA